jgi:FixJ family two-component response regulator
MAKNAARRHLRRGTSGTNGVQQGLQTEIAIVDDDPTVRGSLARLLESCSYRVKAYESAKEFLNSNRLQMSSCLILDLQMEGMTGAVLQHYLAVTGAKIPVIILTAKDAPWVRERCQEAGAVDFLVKPVTPDQLLRAIETALSTRLH